MEILERGANREFDPYPVKLMRGYLQFATTPDWDSNIMRIPLAELEEGQTLVEDLWTRSGVKLLPQGERRIITVYIPITSFKAVFQTWPLYS